MAIIEHVSRHQLRLFTADEYMKMAELGILTADEHLELIEGMIFKMHVVKPLHGGLITMLTALLNEQLSQQTLLSVQNPIQLSTHDMPFPDLAILKPHKDYYRFYHPTASDVLAVIEVSDTTLWTDQTTKMRMYGAANIPEYWIVNAAGNVVEQYTQPTPQGYTQKVILTSRDNLKSVQFSALSISIEQLFAPI